MPSIIEAVKQGDEAQILLLLDRGADVNGAKNTLRRPIFEAVRAGHEAIVRLLLDRGAAVNYSWLRCESPLVEAVTTRNEGLVRLLLDRGADMMIANSYNTQGLTPLASAAMAGTEQ